MRTTTYKPGKGWRQSYGYERLRATPVTTKSGRTTRRTRKQVTEKLYEDTSFRSSKKDYPIKAMAYKVTRDGTYKIARRKKLGKHGLKKQYVKGRRK